MAKVREILYTFWMQEVIKLSIYISRITHEHNMSTQSNKSN